MNAVKGTKPVAKKIAKLVPMAGVRKIAAQMIDISAMPATGSSTAQTYPPGDRP